LFLSRLGLVLATALMTAIVVTPARAEKVNCNNEFRSGKLYFDQKIFEKALAKFAVAVEHCPDKGEFHARYALALCEMGQKYVGQLETAEEAERDTLLSKGLGFFEKAGRELDAALQTKAGKKKKLKKFVKQNRGHYWVHYYNEGLELFEEGDYKQADLNFRIARLINPEDIRSYGQEAITLIRLDDIPGAKALVDSGLVRDPENERLLGIQTSITRDTARNLANSADSDNDPAKVVEALALYDKLVEATPDDPNLIFERGLAALTGAGVVPKEDQAALYERAIADFRAAADLVPADGENRDFHVNCLFNIVQAYSLSGNVEKGLTAGREYTCIAPMDPAGWQFMAGFLIDNDEQTGAVSALMMSKSLAGNEVPVAVATDSATKDAKAALASNGKPDNVFTYQEASSGNQIQTWIWSKAHKAVSFILGDESGQVTWCDQ